jgi:microcystin-dependent protein
MKHYGIEMEGKFYSEQLASVPGWTSNDESRLIYDQSGEKLYFGDSTSWIRLASITEVQEVASIPAGTYMLFAQASAPTGWTRDNVLSHSSQKRTIMLADDGEAGALTGGSYDLIGRSLSHAHSTSSHTLTSSQMPVHGHTLNYTRFDGWGTGHAGGNTLMKPGIITDSMVVTNAGSGGSHNHGNTGSGGGTLDPRYVTVIVAIRD